MAQIAVEATRRAGAKLNETLSPINTSPGCSTLARGFSAPVNTSLPLTKLARSRGARALSIVRPSTAKFRRDTVSAAPTDTATSTLLRARIVSYTANGPFTRKSESYSSLRH